MPTSNKMSQNDLFDVVFLFSANCADMAELYTYVGEERIMITYDTILAILSIRVFINN